MGRSSSSNSTTAHTTNNDNRIVNDASGGGFIGNVNSLDNSSNDNRVTVDGGSIVGTGNFINVIDAGAIKTAGDIAALSFSSVNKTISDALASVDDAGRNLANTTNSAFNFGRDALDQNETVYLKALGFVSEQNADAIRLAQEALKIGDANSVKTAQAVADAYANSTDAADGNRALVKTGLVAAGLVGGAALLVVALKK